MNSPSAATTASPTDLIYFRELCEHLGAAVIATDSDLNIRFWNEGAKRLFHMDAEPMIGTAFVSIIPAERRKFVLRLLKLAMDKGSISEFEFQHHDDSAGEREMFGVIAPIVAQSPDRSGCSICIMDITRRIALFAEHSEARKMNALSEMSAGVAHHFNNILGGIVMALDFASAAQDPEIIKRVLRQINTGVLRATSLVNGLLAFSRGEARADDLSDLTELINNMADEIERMIDGRGIAFTLNMAKLPVWPVPALQLTTIMRNIVQNAVEAMPNGGKLTLDVTSNDALATITIRDTGVGIDEAAKARIFEPFWTTKGGIGKPAGATGMGLAVAHGLAKVIGATITFESAPGKGTSFAITVPRPAE